MNYILFFLLRFFIFVLSRALSRWPQRRKNFYATDVSTHRLSIRCAVAWILKWENYIWLQRIQHTLASVIMYVNTHKWQLSNDVVLLVATKRVVHARYKIECFIEKQKVTIFINYFLRLCFLIGIRLHQCFIWKDSIKRSEHAHGNHLPNVKLTSVHVCRHVDSMLTINQWNVIGATAKLTQRVAMNYSYPIGINWKLFSVKLDENDVIIQWIEL